MQVWLFVGNKYKTCEERHKKKLFYLRYDLLVPFWLVRWAKKMNQDPSGRHLLEILLLTRMMFDFVFLHTPFRNTLVYIILMMQKPIILMILGTPLLKTRHLQETTVVLPFCLPLLPATFLPEPLSWLLFLKRQLLQSLLTLPFEHVGLNHLISVLSFPRMSTL